MNYILLLWTTHSEKNTFYGYEDKEEALASAKMYWEKGDVQFLSLYATNGCILTEYDLK